MSAAICIERWDELDDGVKVEIAGLLRGGYLNPSCPESRKIWAAEAGRLSRLIVTSGCFARCRAAVSES